MEERERLILFPVRRRLAVLCLAYLLGIYGAQIVAAANAICGGKLTLAAETRPIGGGLILKKGQTEINCELETQVGMLRDALAIEIANVLFA